MSVQRQEIVYRMVSGELSYGDKQHIDGMSRGGWFVTDKRIKDTGKYSQYEDPGERQWHDVLFVFSREVIGESDIERKPRWVVPSGRVWKRPSSMGERRLR